jgi:predicted peptidase
MAGSSYDGKMMRVSMLVGLLVTVIAQTNAGVSSAEVKNLETKITRTARLQYLVQVPGQYQTERQKRWPLLVFLHGGSGRGSDIALVKRYGPPVVAEKRTDFPFVLVSPQCAEGEIWTDTEALMAMIDLVQREYRIDSRRIYLTGISMGGRGALYLAYKYPSRFAGVAALAPISPITAWARGFGATPVLIVHGDKDTSAPIGDSKQMVDAARQAKCTIDFTVLPGRDHFIADFYEGCEIYDWLLKHHR